VVCKQTVVEQAQPVKAIIRDEDRVHRAIFYTNGGSISVIAGGHSASKHNFIFLLDFLRRLFQYIHIIYRIPKVVAVTLHQYIVSCGKLSSPISIKQIYHNM
jgi:hypothetical protein